MNRKVSIAPMMDCTDRHERYFLRLISKNVLLYTEMIVSEAIDRGDKNNYFGRTEFDSPEVDNEVIIPVTNSHLRVGEFYDVQVTGAREYDLIGKIK